MGKMPGRKVFDDNVRVFVDQYCELRFSNIDYSEVPTGAKVASDGSMDDAWSCYAKCCVGCDCEKELKGKSSKKSTGKGKRQ